MKLYRYEDMVSESSVLLRLRIFTALRETPKGYWVIEFHNSYQPEINEKYKKWVSKTSIKRLCYPTKEEAWINFNARKNRQLSILKTKVRMIDIASRLTLEKPSFSHEYQLTEQN